MHITYTMKTIWWAQNDEDGLGAEWMEWAEIPKHKCNLQNNKWHSNLKFNSSMQPGLMHETFRKNQCNDFDSKILSWTLKDYCWMQHFKNSKCGDISIL